MRALRRLMKPAFFSPFESASVSTELFFLNMLMVTESDFPTLSRSGWDTLRRWPKDRSEDVEDREAVPPAGCVL